ncbi:hypothetical protein GDO81_023210 [Engystomops pustulosus]|uniref:Uncharacterized protein n=1 Tax=Engystomops pustulosus TaxID=76066 RepID=A0AAV6Z793_ENGPU|nr:hypothetical protein GDO81_023210 [Engystomops pustulosus]
MGNISPVPQVNCHRGAPPHKTLATRAPHVLAFLPLWLLGDFRRGDLDDRVLLAGLAVRELRRTRSAGGHGRFLLSLELPCGEDDGLGELTLGGLRFLMRHFSWIGTVRGERPRGDLEKPAELGEMAGEVWFVVCGLVLPLRVRGVLTITSSSDESSLSASEEFCSFVSTNSALNGLHFLCREVLVT